jgi:hypothetical protein
VLLCYCGLFCVAVLLWAVLCCCAVVGSSVLLCYCGQFCVAVLLWAVLCCCAVVGCSVLQQKAMPSPSAVRKSHRCGSQQWPVLQQQPTHQPRGFTAIGQNRSPVKTGVLEWAGIVNIRCTNCAAFKLWTSGAQTVQRLNCEHPVHKLCSV